MRKRRRIRAILWFSCWCAVFSLAFTRAYWIADSLLLATLVVAFIVFTAAKVRQLWKYRSDPEMREAIASSGQGSVFSAWRRWASDENEGEKPN
jgi:steroid 5-alpha reductase family enzyme